MIELLNGPFGIAFGVIAILVMLVLAWRRTRPSSGEPEVPPAIVKRAVLDKLYPVLGSPAVEGRSLDSLDNLDIRIARVAAWAASLQDRQVRQAYKEWLEFYAAESAKARRRREYETAHPVPAPEIEPLGHADAHAAEDKTYELDLS